MSAVSKVLAVSLKRHFFPPFVGGGKRFISKHRRRSFLFKRSSTEAENEGAFHCVAATQPPVLSGALLQQQLQVQHLSQLQGLALPVTPLPLGLTPPTLPAVSSSSGLLSLSSILANYSHGQAQAAKEDKAREAAERAPRGEDGDKSD